jgi:hypothetical protein
MLANGKSSSSGGALYIRPGVTVVANGCVFSGNLATATNGVSGANGITNSTDSVGGKRWFGRCGHIGVRRRHL